MENKKQIFFLHFAGGNCFSYNFLAPHLDMYEPHQLELPGRGKRLAEPFAANRKAAVADYVQQILNLLNGNPFVIYGHSMGAQLGLEVVAQLEKLNYFPDKLLVSGNAGPDPNKVEQKHLLGRKAFIKELKDMGGMPADFFEHEDLVDLYIPILKSDFKIVEEHPAYSPRLTKTEIIALMGNEEEEAVNISNWKKFTMKKCEYKVLKGNHFFIYDHRDLLAELIKGSFRENVPSN